MDAGDDGKTSPGRTKIKRVQGAEGPRVRGCFKKVGATFRLRENVGYRLLPPGDLRMERRQKSHLTFFPARIFPPLNTWNRPGARVSRGIKPDQGSRGLMVIITIPGSAFHSAGITSFIKTLFTVGP